MITVKKRSLLNYPLNILTFTTQQRFGLYTRLKKKKTNKTTLSNANKRNFLIEIWPNSLKLGHFVKGIRMSSKTSFHNPISTAQTKSDWWSVGWGCYIMWAVGFYRKWGVACLHLCGAINRSVKCFFAAGRISIWIHISNCIFVTWFFCFFFLLVAFVVWVAFAFHVISWTFYCI